MHHYNATFPSRVLPETAGSFRQHSAGSEDHGSQSGSDDGMMVGAYAGAQGVEIDLDEDAHSLTSQTLNADGTPKRPMNAFMIFARRRRPQVSAENQSMRTGEISKILSKEWNSMPTSEKQFYLDQAKILKDNFNNKYPDYVYRRRPNNSRKKRRSDAASHSVDNAAGSDHGDEASMVGDYGEPSPVEDETSMLYGANPSQPRPAIDATSYTGSIPFDGPYMFSPQDDTFSVLDTRPSQRHVSQDPLSPSSHLSQSLNYPYLSGQNDPRAHPYAQAHAGHSSAAWDSAPSGRTASTRQWVGNSLERPMSSLDRSAKLHHHHSYSPTSAQSSDWPGSSPSVSPVGIAHQNNNLFPTLSLPYFPGGQAQGNNNSTHSSSYPGTASSGSSHSSSPSLFDTGGNMLGNPNPLLAMPSSNHLGRPESRYSNRSISTSAVPSGIVNTPMPPYPPVHQDGNHFHHRAPVHRGQSHPHLPSNYQQLQSHVHTVSPTSASPSSHSDFWAGERFR